MKSLVCSPVLLICDKSVIGPVDQLHLAWEFWSNQMSRDKIT